MSLVNPQIIVVEKIVSRKIVERLRKIGYTMIVDVSKDELKRLANMTQTIILPSVDFLDESFKCGTCEEFIVQAQMDDKVYSKNTSHYYTRYNWYFRGWSPHLGWTICFTGDEDEELQTIKSCFRAILDAWREELLGNGFERRDYSIVTPNNAMQNSNLRYKTTTTMIKGSSFQPNRQEM